MFHPARVLATLIFGFGMLYGGDGYWVAFASARSGNGDLFAVNTATGVTKPLRVNDLAEGTLRYDAARQRLVYTRFQDDAPQATLYSGDQKLFVDPNGDVAPQWSPDGRTIVYAARRDGRDDLYLADSNGAGERALTQDAEIDRYPAWSPDSRSVVFARRTTAGWNLYRRDIQGDAAPIALTTLNQYVGHPVWSPDGKHIAFDTLYEGQAEIALLTLADGVVQRLTQRPGNDLAPAWSPDSRALAWAGEPNNNGNWDVWLMHLADRKIVQLTQQEGFDGGPVFVASPAALKP